MTTPTTGSQARTAVADPLALGVAARCAHDVASIADYKAWTRECIRPLFPHEMLLSGYGSLHAAGLSLDCAVGVDFPWDYLSCIQNRLGTPDTPILRAYLATREPQLFSAEAPPAETPAAWLACFREHDLRNVAAHGELDAERGRATYHSFYRVSGRLGAWHAESLKRLVPLMHAVLCGVIGRLRSEADQTPGLDSLSARERDIVDAVRQGLSNLQIGLLCGVSENTVKHHLTSIFGKLKVSTRGQLMHKLRMHELHAASYGGVRRL